MVAKAWIHMGEDIIMEIRQILAPTDYPTCSKQAVTDAYELAPTCGAQLLWLQIVQLLVYPVEALLPSAEVPLLVDDRDRQGALNLAKLLPKA
jgi:hypothetical protein